MAEERSSLHIDTDWKKQAQEEKKRLAEQQQQQQQKAVAPAGVIAGATAPAAGIAAGGRAGGTGREERGLPRASFETLVQSILTQSLYYMGDIAARGMAPNINLDMAKHHLDTLALLEEKTANNLNEEERRTLDGALYESRMRFIEISWRYAELP